ncbi:hypothetical protein [Pseudomonas crudilactis]|uniref:hypothetical protein n=1 Tax=Pseudomonas crudilactis TaxID=2697028 RepID=UPI00036874D8|nr:hypothetical protein [Pseudomonas crudilactis]
MNANVQRKLNKIFSSDQWLEGSFDAVVKGPEGETYNFSHQQVAYRSSVDGNYHILDNVVTDHTFEGLRLNVAIGKNTRPGDYTLETTEDLPVAVILGTGFFFGFVKGKLRLEANSNGALSGTFSGEVSLGGLVYKIQSAKFVVEGVPI